MTYLPVAGLQRPNCRFTNAIRCLPNTPGGKLDSKKPAHLALLESCTKANLYPEIERLNPSVIVPMGAFACRAIDPEIDLRLHHGIPLECSDYIVFPMYHPAQGLHDPKKVTMLRTDWIRLKEYFHGTLHIPEDTHPNPDYKEATESDIRMIDPTIDMACDTEWSRKEGAYVFTYSQYPGTARLIRAGSPLFKLLQAKLDRYQALIWFHNWLYDWDNITALGLEMPRKRMRDSMVLCFHLGNMPQALKELAYRELGMEMQDFDDLVIPHSRPEVFDYYRAAYNYKWPKPEPYQYRDEDGELKIKRPQSMNTKLKRFFTDYSKNPDKDVFNMWEENWVDEQQMIEEKLGPWPGKDIAHVPFNEMLYYACRDADALIRLIPILKAMRRVVRFEPQEKWRSYANN